MDQRSRLDKKKQNNKIKEPEQIEMCHVAQAAKLVDMADLERDQTTDIAKKRQKQAADECVWVRIMFTSDGYGVKRDKCGRVGGLGGGGGQRLSHASP